LVHPSGVVARTKTFWEHLVAERLVLTIIVLNAIVLFLRAFEGWEARADSILWAVDYACTAFFAVELIVKVRLLGWTAYWASGWNKFDFIVVVASSPHLLAPFLDVEDFAIILILRTARLARMMRLMHFIPDRERLWSGMLRALRASVGVLIALLLYNFVLGLCACYLFRDTGSPYFSDPFTSIYSVFKVFTIEGWYEIPDSVAAAGATGAGMATFVRLFFVFTVATGGLLGISLANAVFVDEMVLDNTSDIEGYITELRAEVQAAREESAESTERLQRTLDDLRVRLAALTEEPDEPVAIPADKDPPSPAR
jgi:voltage-gated sodium channel